MSVDMDTTVKTWNDVPERYKRRLGELIEEIQTDMLSHFGIVDSISDVDDENDNGSFPEIDIEVHVIDDPDASTRRLVITSSPEDFQGKYKLKDD
tara:strand:- start:1128 stop:1412 length:285 start_codon:yes stop_codon:yes gene_type:complete